MMKKLVLILIVIFVFLTVSGVFAAQKQDNIEIKGKITIVERSGNTFNFEGAGLNISKLYLYEGELRIKFPLDQVKEIRIAKEKKDLKDESGNYIYFIGTITKKGEKAMHGIIPIWKHAKIYTKDKKKEFLLKDISEIKFQ